MDNYISPFFDPIIYILRLFLGIIRLTYLSSIKLVWKFLPIGSRSYQFIRKIVRQRNSNRVEVSSDSAEWKERIYLFITTPTRIDLSLQNNKSKKSKTSFVFVLPLNSINESALVKTAVSLALQSFPHWNLHLAFSQNMSIGEQTAVLELLSHYLPINKYKTIEVNPFFKDVTFLIYINAGDIIRPDCLYWISKEGPFDLISFDITLLRKDGKNQLWCRPPGNSPELMISSNYLSHAAIKTTKIRELLDREELDSSDCMQSDFPILYKLVIDDSATHRHISKILYVSGIISNSGVDISSRKDTIHKEFSRQGLTSIQFDTLEANSLRVTWKTDGEKVSIIIPSKDKVHLIKTCIESIRQHTSYLNFEILIVDNHSIEPETLAYYQSVSLQPDISIIPFDAPFNYSKAINLGASHARGKYLLILNNDMRIFRDDWLTEMIQWAMLREVGVVGAKLLYPNNTIQHAGIVLDSNRLISHVFCHQPQNTTGPHGSVDWYRNYVGVTGACQMIRKEVFDSVGGYDEQFVLTYSDVDICLRLMKLGYRVVYDPFSIIYHYESASRTNTNPVTDIKRACTKIKDFLVIGDPYLNEQIVDPFNPRVRLFEPEMTKIIRYRVEMENRLNSMMNIIQEE